MRLIWWVWSTTCLVTFFFFFFFFYYRYFLCHVSSGQDFESSLVSSFTQGYSEDASWTVYLFECPTGQDPSSKFTQIVNSLSPQVYMVEASVPSQGFFQVFNQRSALFQTLPRVFKSCYGVLGRTAPQGDCFLTGTLLCAKREWHVTTFAIFCWLEHRSQSLLSARKTGWGMVSTLGGAGQRWSP